MIQKFRWKFISLSIASLFIVIFVTIGSLVAVNFYQDHQEVDRVLNTLVQNNGNLTLNNSQDIYKDKDFIFNQKNPESIFQYRYFTVSVAPNNKIIITKQPEDFKLSKQDIYSKAGRIANSRFKKGMIRLDHSNYAYQIFFNDQGQKSIIFLNTSLIFTRSWNLLRLAVFLGIIALLVFASILIITSGKAINPIVIAYKKQQQFITNAGHELKTPLAIISANTEMQEMIGNESEWTKSTKEQIERLTNLVNNLISLARMSETGELALEKVNLSEVTQQNCKDFASLVKQKKLTLKESIQPNISVLAEEKTLKELINIFLDNAQKYCDPDGIISVDLRKNKLNTYAHLTISNTYSKGKNKNYKNFFDRFYREDESHNNKKSGFGIGLSMAQDLVHAFKGKLKVNYHNEEIHFTISLKLAK
ncbi:HAMP domain-containing sensor histidine kinase [uncultured Lactobacillus sp.]|uniref:sensor histidine kinase n=1 Tax=uncultured Lactobacillus sp. TaxID=153152 RepID=UPI00261AEDC4|nr:HAMP domain-containing sensor histidine kinase [uncultured Lactobacillus sp.]